LRHENILPLVGVSYNFGVLPAPISEWQNNGMLQFSLEPATEMSGDRIGTIMAYLEKTPGADRYELLRGIARGLAFLHGKLSFDPLYNKCAQEYRPQSYDRPRRFETGQFIFRANASSFSYHIQDNILINKSGGPYLSDFGISTVYDDHTSWATATKNVSGTIRYMSPELLTGDAARPTSASDVYAYAMTCMVSAHLFELAPL
jgi:serine/threonine protein kinase